MMHFANRHGVVGLTLALAVATTALAQPQTRQRTSPSLSMYSILFLGDPLLQKELKLTEAQVKKLDEQRNKLTPASLLGSG